MATEADVVRRVLRRLHVIEGGEVPSAEDDAAVTEVLGDIHAELQEKSLAYWSLTDIPAAVLPGLVRMVAADAAPTFIDGREALAYESWRPRGERMIRTVIASQADHEPIHHIYF